MKSFTTRHCYAVNEKTKGSNTLTKEGSTKVLEETDKKKPHTRTPGHPPEAGKKKKLSSM